MNELNLLQSLDLAARPEVESLYFQPDEELVVGLERPRLEAARLYVPAGQRVSFDTYFNAFFETYWFGYTHVESVQLRLKVEGDCEISVWRQSPDRDVYLLGRKRVDDSGEFSFQLDHDDELRAEAGRVWFEVEAHGPTVVTEGGWLTAQAPERPVALAVVFCTFNREKYLQRILRSIDDHELACERISRLFVINQGNPFTADEIVGDSTTGRVLDKLEILVQPNMGGCGGFTRGIHETLVDDSLTHFVLLDDDIRIHPDSLARLHSFMAYARDGVAVGGHMLNLHRPNFLFEAGADLHPESLQPTPLHQNTYLGEKSGLEALLRGGPVEYNGWWLFGADKKVIEEIGYPMPCFIRGDDIEFGMRLRRANKLTIPIPGIAVWHEPFYLKLGGWQFFFEVRNRLAAASLHQVANWDGIRGDLQRVFARDIAMSRYHSTELMLEALRAYLAGPSEALTSTDQALLRARRIVDEAGPRRIDFAGKKPVGREDEGQRGELHRMLNRARAGLERRVSKLFLIGQLGRRAVVAEAPDAAPSLTVRAAELKPHIAARHDCYVVVDEHSSVAWEYRRDRARERDQWKRFRSMISQVGPDTRYLEAREASRHFAADWEKTFGNIEQQVDES